MRALLIAACVAIALTSSAQISGKKVESIKIFDSIEVKAGDTIYLGNGTDRRGDFVYIYQPPNVLVGVAETSLPRNYANKHFVIKFFKLQKNKKSGDKTVAVINPGGLNYVADLEAAIQAKEILAINDRSFEKKEQPSTVIVQQPASAADEIAKLKKLLDSGAITQEEYDAAKKKLLEKQ